MEYLFFFLFFLPSRWMNDKFSRRKIPYTNIMPLHWTEWTSALNVSNWIIYIFTQFSLTRKLSSLEYDLPFFFIRNFLCLKQTSSFFFSWFEFGGKEALSIYFHVQQQQQQISESSAYKNLIKIYIKRFKKP